MKVMADMLHVRLATACPWSTGCRSPRSGPRRAASGRRALNVASTMWWVFLPRTSSMCSVMAGLGGEGPPELLDQLRIERRVAEDLLAGERRPRRRGTGGPTGRGPRRPAPRRAAPGSRRTGARRPCRRARRGTPRPGRCRRPRRCGARRSRGRPWPGPTGRTRRGGRAGSACGRRTAARSTTSTRPVPSTSRSMAMSVSLVVRATAAARGAGSRGLAGLVM